MAGQRPVLGGGHPTLTLWQALCTCARTSRKQSVRGSGPKEAPATVLAPRAAYGPLPKGNAM